MTEFTFPNSTSNSNPTLTPTPTPTPDLNPGIGVSSLNNPSTFGPAAPGNAGASASVHQQPLTDRVAQTAHHTIDRLVETATPHIERMEGAVTQATIHLKDQAQHVREKGDEWANDLRASVRRNPLTAVALAMAAGALIVRLKR